MIGEQSKDGVREREVLRPPNPIRVYRLRDDGTEELIADDWCPPEKKTRSGREVYRNSMLRPGHIYTGGE